MEKMCKGCEKTYTTNQPKKQLCEQCCKERHRERCKKYAQTNIAYQKAYREKNKEQIKAYQREYRKENKKRIRKYQQKYYTNANYFSTTDNIIKRKLRTHRAIDIKTGRGAPNNYITYKWIIDTLMKQGNRCKYCNKKMKVEKFKTREKRAFTVERMDNTKPHTQNNCVCACLSCNLKRGKRTYDQFMNYMKQNTSMSLCSQGKASEIGKLIPTM